MENQKDFYYIQKEEMMKNALQIIIDRKPIENIDELLSKDDRTDFAAIAFNRNRNILDIPITSFNSSPEEKRITELIPLINKLLKEFYSHYGFETIKNAIHSRDLKENSIFDINKVFDYYKTTEKNKQLFPFIVLLFNKAKQYYDCYFKLISSFNTNSEFEDRIAELANKFNIPLPEKEKKRTEILLHFPNLYLEYQMEYQNREKERLKKVITELLSLPNLQLSFEERREIEQYSAIIYQKIYQNLFVDSNYSEKYRTVDFFTLFEVNYDFKKLNKKEFCQKEYFKIAFKNILSSCEEVGIIFKKYDLDDFYINGLAGLTLFQYDNLENWEEKITHILRCDNCHNQVKHDIESYLTSSTRSQEATFKCPNCGKTYTYSDLIRIYQKNCYNSYK